MRDRSASPAGRGESRGQRGGRGGRGDRGGRRDRFRGSRGGSSRDFSRGDLNGSADAVDRNYENSIFIGNVPFESTSDDIRNLFTGYNLVRADIVTSRGRSRGMATVEFGSQDDAKRAIEQFDHHELQGREIFVRQDHPPPEKKREREERRPRERRERPAVSVPPGQAGPEVFVGNLPFSVSWQNLKDLMREAGNVIRADVKTDSWGKSRGFGTVIFSTEEEAAYAIEKFQGYDMGGRRIDLRPGRGENRPPAAAEDRRVTGQNTEFTRNVTGNGERSNTIYTTNLPFVTNVDDLYELFETIGKVTRAEIQFDDRGRPSGNAVVQFDLDDLAEQAITNLNNYNYGGRELGISYSQKAEVAAE